MVAPLHGLGQPSAWLKKWQHLMAPAGHVLDVACGAGRHTRHLLAHGFDVTAVDKDAAALAHLSDTPAQRLLADLEVGAWPFAPNQFDAAVMTNYLWRPLFGSLIASLKPGGVLVFETFALGQESIGKPSRPAFLLAPNEALTLCAPLRVVAYENGFEDAQHSSNATVSDRFVQRIVAVKEHKLGAATPRYLLP
jgi:SAM-dependent methyltransferase